MSDLNIALVLKFIDQATAPARAAMQNIQGAAQVIERHGAQHIAQGRAMQETAAVQTQALGRQAIATAGAGFALYAALQPAVQFESQMSKVAAVTRANEDDQAALAAQAMALGAATRFSASEAAQGMEALGRAGLGTNEIITAMPGMLDLAAASGAGLGETADYATNILSGFQLQVDQMGRVGDTLVNTFTSSNTDLADLALTMEYAGPIASNLGVDLETTAAMAGRLGDSGLAGEKGGTALRAVLSRLAAPSKEAGRALDELGVSVSDANGDMRGIPDILADMEAAMGGMGDTARQQMQNVIFGMEGAGAAAILMREAGTGALQDYIDNLHETGSAARVAAQMSDNAQGALDRLRSVVESAQIAFGNGLLPVLRDTIDVVAPLVASFGGWITENQELVTTVGYIAAGLIALSAGSLAAQYGFWMLFSWVGKLRVAFGFLLRAVSLVNPIFWVVAAIASAVYVIYQNWDNIVSYFTEKFDRVKAAFQEGFLSGLIALWQEFNVFTLIRDAAEGLFTYLTGWTFDDVQAALNRALNSEAFRRLRDVAEAVFTFITGWTFDDVGAALRAVFDFDLFEAGAELISSLGAGIWSVLTGMVERVRAALSDIVPRWLIDAWNWVQGDGTLSTGSGSRREGRTSGARDSGGVVRPGFLYEINERNQEFFMPDLPGRVLNASVIAGLAGGAANLIERLPDIPGPFTSPEPRPQSGILQPDQSRRAAQVTHQGDTINISIHTSGQPGDIERELRRFFDAREREKRGWLHDGALS
ncbi:phage tail tape measure protein [Roseinatronobacter sp.]|uniref:phage tail tape measure protein n=1 Tax=Roseinatronobacter sp. TaxID=1945755 RepID=UPI0025E7DEB3|nr:phage tail tape measure protein [Roseibaca sp.]